MANRYKVTGDGVTGFFEKHWKLSLIVVLFLLFRKKIMAIFSGLFSAGKDIADGVTDVTTGVKNGVKDLTDALGLTVDAAINDWKAFTGKIGSPLVAATFDAWQASIPAGTPLITTATQLQLAKQIYDSEGILLMNEQSMLGAFKTLKNLCQVALLAKKFQQVYKTDLETYLEHSDSFWHGGFKPVYLKALTDYLASLPKY